MFSLGVVLILTAIVWVLIVLGYVDESFWNIIVPLILLYFGFSMIMKSCNEECMLCKCTSKKVLESKAKKK